MYYNLFIKHEERKNWQEEINNEQNKDSVNSDFIIIDI